MSTKKKIEQIKKIESLDHQLLSTINKIEQINKPPKMNKKHLSILLSIPLALAVFLTAIVTFLVIDPFRWYTTSYDTYLVKRKEKIVDKFKSFTMPDEVVLQENAKTVKNLLEEIQHKPDLVEVFASINERFSFDTVISIYDGNRLLTDKTVLTSKTYQMKFNFVDYDINIAISIDVIVRISPF